MTINVIVRTPAGASHPFAVALRDTVGDLIDRCVEHFVDADQLEAGLFRLGLLRGTTIVDLAPDDDLADAAEEGDVLHLVTCEPQVDG